MRVYGVEAMPLTVDGRTRRARGGETYRHTPFLRAYNARTPPSSLEISVTEPPETVLDRHIQPIMTSLSSIFAYIPHFFLGLEGPQVLCC